MVQTGLLELVGRSDSDWAGDSATRQSVTGYHCDVQNVTMCNRSLKQTAISLNSCEAEFYAASACAAESLGLAELFKELHLRLLVLSYCWFSRVPFLQLCPVKTSPMHRPFKMSSAFLCSVTGDLRPGVKS